MVSAEVKRMSARELFEAARDASRDAEYLKRRIERMELGEGLRAASLEPSSRSPVDDVNGTSRVNARMDFEAAVSSRVEDDYAVIDYACAVLYGADGRGGIAALLCPEAADLLWHHYLDCESMGVAADSVGIPRRSAFRMRDRAFDLADMLGFESCAAGEGAAEA